MFLCGDLYLSFSLFVSMFLSALSLVISLSISLYFFLKWPKIAPTWHHHGTKNFPNRAQMGPRAAQMEPKWRQDGVKTAKKQEKRANATKKWAACQDVAPFDPKVELTWPQLGSQNGAKMLNKSITKLIFFC